MMARKDAVLGALLACLVGSISAQCSSNFVCDCSNYASNKEVRCDSRNLISIPPNLPADTKYLRLEFNQISSIGPGDLSDLTQLRSLTIYNNLVSNIDTYAFRYQQNLEVLSLQNNRLSSLHSQTFWELGKLTQLNLDSNQFTTFQNVTFQALVKLTTLTLTGNPLESLPDGIFRGLSNLQVLDMSNIALQTISGTIFSGLISLLTLKMNDVTQNGDEVFGSENLFVSVSNLTTLEVKGNGLTCIPAALSVLRSIRTLKMSRNPLTCDDFSGLQNFENLEELHLDETNLITLRSGMFARNTNLSFLFVAYSMLSEVENGAFEGLSRIQDLLLLSNNLSSLPINVFDPIPNDAILDLAENPWNCDCNLRWLHEWLTETYTGNIDDLAQPSCTTPERFQGQLVINVEDTDFACMPESVATNTTHVVNQGENFELECSITGDPTPDLHWLTPDHTELRPGTSQPPFSVDASCTLTIIRIQEEDAGAYSCVGTNSAGTLSVRNLVTVTPTGVERPSEAAPSDQVRTTFLTTATPWSDPSSADKNSTVAIVIALVGGIVVVVFIVVIIILCRRSNRKSRLARMPEGGMIFRNEPLTNPCASTCANGVAQYPSNTRYAETLPRVPDSSPLDPPPPYSTIPPQSTYEEIYDQIIDDTYERPRQPGDITHEPSPLNHVYLSQIQRQESTASQRSCGAPAGYERSLIRDKCAQRDYHKSDEDQDERGDLTVRYVAMQESKKQKTTPRETEVSVTNLDPDAKITYQNTRRM